MTVHKKLCTMYSMSLFFLSLFSSSEMRVCNDRIARKHRMDICDIHARQVWIIVHGTFAQGAKWYQKEGDFYTELTTALSDTAYIYSFKWSGKLKHDARVQAAYELVDFIEHHSEPKDIINIVGHSHGGTVAVLAARFLKEKQSEYHITQLFTLAPPVSRELYSPDMENIDYLYNIFSFGDLIQPTFGLSERVYTEHAQIWNIEIKRDGMSLDHSDIHCCEVAQLLPQLQVYVKGNNTTILHLQTSKEHFSEEDFEREKWLVLDQKNMQDILRVSVEGIRRKYPQKIVLKVMHVSYEKFNQKVKQSTVIRWYNRFRARRN